MHIPRFLLNEILENLRSSRKIIIIYGPRQVGKTTLAKEAVARSGLKSIYINADQQKHIDILSSRDLQKMESLLAGYELLFLDEAQRIPDIGINLKFLADEKPNLKIIVTGSSSFDLAQKISEPLTGRTWSYTLYPIAFIEIKKNLTPFELNNKLEDFLVFGSYPEIAITINHQQKQKLLEEICRSYLFKDIFELATIKHTHKIKELVQLLAYQAGSEASLTELSNGLNLSHDTVERYIDLLEKAFVVFRVSGFSRNLRKEVRKMDKIFFYDLGVRNAIIDNFKPLKERNDLGQLWENFLVVERKKCLSYHSIYANAYFWRTHTGAELDYVEEREGKLFGFEFKSGTKKARPPKSWKETYPHAEFSIVNQENYLNFIT